MSFQAKCIDRRDDILVKIGIGIKNNYSGSEILTGAIFTNSLEALSGDFHREFKRSASNPETVLLWNIGINSSSKISNAYHRQNRPQYLLCLLLKFFSCM